MRSDQNNLRYVDLFLEMIILNVFSNWKAEPEDPKGIILHDPQNPFLDTYRTPVFVCEVASDDHGTETIIEICNIYICIMYKHTCMHVHMYACTHT